MKPHVHGPFGDEIVDPFLREKIVNVTPAQTCANPGNDFLIKAVLQASHGSIKHILASPPLIADDLRPFNRYQRGNVAQSANFFGDIFRDELPVSEHLEKCIGVTR